jgi:phosphatidylcholine synthase
VHAFTASGALVGAAALLAIAAGDLPRAAILMLVALVIDSTDGALARAVRVRDVIPNVDGRRLDDMVDYLNYVIVPAVFVVAAGSVTSWAWTALPILASAYGFSQEDAKTEDNFFLGWPSYWNVLALYLWLFEAPPLAGTCALVLFSVLIFVPFKYIYPSKMPRQHRSVAGTCATLWLIAMVLSILAPQLARRWRLLELSLGFPLYYLALSFWLGGLHRKPR